MEGISLAWGFGEIMDDGPALSHHLLTQKYEADLSGKSLADV